jgi:hypothetical protein
LVLGLENNLIAFWDAHVNTKKSRSTMIEAGQYYMVLGARVGWSYWMSFLIALLSNLLLSLLLSNSN